MSKPIKKWMRLDNAATIYPAAKRRNWTALFRLSANVGESVDVEILKAALARTLRRFPWFSMRMKAGAFWYYLEQNDREPIVEEDVSNPCVRMRFNKNNGFSFRVRYYDDRIAVEIFHTLSDGTGGLSIFKTMLAEYLTLKYGIEIPRDDSILDCDLPPDPEHYDDGFETYASGRGVSRSESNSYRIRGTKEEDAFINITTGIIPVDILKAKAKEKGVSITEYLAAAMIVAIDSIQREKKPYSRNLKPVKICVPVNLRSFFPSRTLRNFASYVNPGIKPKYGIYSFDEILKIVHHEMGIEITQKTLLAKFTTNVNFERNLIMRVVPLFMKNVAMKTGFLMTGDRKTSTCFSNLGNVTLPEEMAKYVTRLDFILGPLSINPVATAAVSYNGKLYLNFTRVIREADVERKFFRFLVKQGIPVKIESNQREFVEDEIGVSNYTFDDLF